MNLHLLPSRPPLPSLRFWLFLLRFAWSPCSKKFRAPAGMARLQGRNAPRIGNTQCTRFTAAVSFFCFSFLLLAAATPHRLLLVRAALDSDSMSIGQRSIFTVWSYNLWLGHMPRLSSSLSPAPSALQNHTC